MACSIMSISKNTFLFAVITIRLFLGNGESAVAPEDTEATTGANVTLYCRSSIAQIEWHHFPVGHSIHEIVYQDGFIFNGYKGRFNVIRDHNNDYNLMIKNVKATDAGKYTCVEKSEDVEQKTAELIVFEQYPSIKFCAAKFTCAPDCDALELTCRMKAHGNIIPSMEWRESANGILTSNSNIENEISTSSIHLQPNNNAAQSYSCRVKYATDSLVATKFIWSYSISAPASLADEKLQVQSNTKVFIAIIALMAATIVGMTAAILVQFFKNKRRKEKFDNSMKSRNADHSCSSKESENGLQSESRRLLDPEDGDDSTRGFVPRTPANKNNSINGIGVLGDEVFLVTRDGCVVEVFDLESAKYKRAWMVAGLVNPNDMAVCPTRNLIFICDWKKAGESREIFCCDKDGNLDCRWISENERGQISVTKESNVIVAESWYNTIREYTYFGRLIMKFEARNQKLHLWHAIKLEDGNFVASFGDAHDENQEICIIDRQGKTLCCINQKSIQHFGAQFSIPRSLAVDKEGTIYVCELHNRRIVLLTPNLQYLGQIDSSKNDEKLRGPFRICVHKSYLKRQILVADNVKKDDKWIDGKILVLNATPQVREEPV